MRRAAAALSLLLVAGALAPTAGASSSSSSRVQRARIVASGTQTHRAFKGAEWDRAFPAFKARGKNRIPALAPAPQDGVTAAFSGGRAITDEASYALARAQSLFHPDRSARRFGRIASPSKVDPTLVLRDLRLRLGELSQTDRRAAQRILARPTDAGEADGYTVGGSKYSCTTHFCIHYVTTSVDAPSLVDANTNLIPDYVETTATYLEDVWSQEVGRLGYRAPKSDIASVNAGPDGKLDVYLQDLGGQNIYGYCTSDDPSGGYDVSAYCALDDDFATSQYGAPPLDSLRVTAAHEFFHAIHFAYDIGEDGWMMESSATWMEDETFDEVNDNYQYLEDGNSPITDPKRSLDYADGDGRLYAYGAFVFWSYLAEASGSSDIVRDAWELADAKVGAPDEISVVAAKKAVTAAGLEWGQTFSGFGAWNGAPASFYEEGSAYPSATRQSSTLVGPTPVVKTVLLDHLASALFDLTPATTASPGDKLKVALDGPPIAASGASILVTDTAGVSTLVPFGPIDALGDGTVSVPFAPTTVKSVTVVLANSSTNLKSCWATNTPYACSGVPVDQSQAFKFTASVIASGQPDPEPTPTGTPSPEPTETVDPDPEPQVTAHPMTISIALRKHLVVKGALLAEDGFAACEAGAPVDILRYSRGEWRFVERTTSSATGGFRATVRDRSGLYAAVSPEGLLGASDLCELGTSRIVRHRH